MKKITLTQGQFAIVDNEDYEALKQWKWYCDIKGGGHKYAMRTNEDGKNIYLHRIVMNCPKEKMIDHKNGNTLDCRKKNLRFCNKSTNGANRGVTIRSASGYKGTYWFKNGNKWQAQIRVNQKNIHLGFFYNKIDAARAYNQATEKYFGEFARLNNI